MENNHIDQQFNEASKLSEEPTFFPGFDTVWDKVEERLDQKKEKKKIIPVWFPYGIAASLMIGIGALYFLNKKDREQPVKQEMAEHKILPEPTADDHIAKIDHITKENIQKEKNKEYPKIEKAIVYTNNVPEPLRVPNPVSTAYPPPAIERHMETSDAVKNIDEIVVTGYGIKKKTAYTTSSVTTVSEMLSGTVAGLSISTPGKDNNIRIRGLSSIKGSTERPLVVVNGIPTTLDALKDMNPKRIKKVSVLKPEEAATLYGSKALHGVVVVKTKRLRRAEKEKLEELYSKSIKELDKKQEEKEKELPKAGQLTAGEVNDFSKWEYWKDIAVPSLEEYKNAWKFYPDRRVSVQLTNKNKKPVIGEKVKLLDDQKKVIWEAVSDNLGNAELWISPIVGETPDSKNYYLSDASGQIISNKVNEFKNGQNLIVLNKPCLEKRKLDIAFVVDATGSMGDEITYLQSELLDVLRKVETNLKNSEIRYGSVFYRDKGDEYITRKFDFSDKAEDLIQFIKNQRAAGGGDTPEAVVEALQVSIDDLKWSPENSTKIMFLILDAPPHQSEENIQKLYDKIKKAAQKGITIIPLAASDTNKETEYIMRAFALLTNGTYTFLTNDSGIGNNHIKPTIDSYEVEKLNSLLLRLILQRATLPECTDGISNENINKKMETEIDRQVDAKTVIFPNPTKGMIKIRTANKIEELYIYDLAGKIIMRKENLEEGKNTIDMTLYPQGIYLVRVRTNNNWETFKVIKN
ncbi:Outer membrane receptor for ferrienterochelin and colicins [Chryseobacterium nakagawai]|uniref:T9SS C-terminal target domain-containing protein n=1 Tax=Chryseobacterium nakagawai TaxID=1241982 RepID=A0AAD0YJR3_CHRNA|nr:T9SS type A sorting domain-containing protein [Chryseobacterium nakagawai]AZA90209.1 T9SS C-terminal target domain-containing protein [Chryseobacterium nakagawai]VEH21677.1 Outer membrane receptor for ferrienterochelin and colicins [Chryseobacterium nakagawai]